MTDQPWKTWIGHGLQGVFVGFVFINLFGAEGYGGAALALLYHFGVREFPGIWGAMGGLNRRVIWDGVLDFVSPFVGLILVAILHTLLT